MTIKAISELSSRLETKIIIKKCLKGRNLEQAQVLKKVNI